MIVCFDKKSATELAFQILGMLKFILKTTKTKYDMLKDYRFVKTIFICKMKLFLKVHIVTLK